MRSWTTRVAAILAILLIPIVVAAEAEKTVFDFKGTDGTNLKGTYYSPGEPGPAVLLVHQCNLDRSSWESLASDLVAAGIHVLTFDLRGFGDSEGEPMTGAESFRTLMQKAPGDVDAAYAYLMSQAGVDKSRVAAGGASCGVMMSAGLATRRPEIKTLVMLSGPAGDEASSHIMATADLAVFGAAAEADSLTPGVHEVMKTTVEGSKNSSSTLKIYGGTEHGTPMFAKNPELEPLVLEFLKSRLLSD